MRDLFIFFAYNSPLDCCLFFFFCKICYFKLEKWAFWHTSCRQFSVILSFDFAYEVVSFNFYVDKLINLLCYDFCFVPWLEKPLLLQDHKNTCTHFLLALLWLYFSSGLFKFFSLNLWSSWNLFQVGNTDLFTLFWLVSQLIELNSHVYLGWFQISAFFTTGLSVPVSFYFNYCSCAVF